VDRQGWFIIHSATTDAVWDKNNNTIGEPNAVTTYEEVKY